MIQRAGLWERVRKLSAKKEISKCITGDNGRVKVNWKRLEMLQEESYSAGWDIYEKVIAELLDKGVLSRKRKGNYYCYSSC